MGKNRKIVIAVFAILTVVATGIAAYCGYKSSTSGIATDINYVVRDKTPQIGDKFYLFCLSDDLFEVNDDLCVFETTLEKEDRNICIPIESDRKLSYRFNVEVVETDPAIPDKFAQGCRDYYQELYDKLQARKATVDTSDSEAMERIRKAEEMIAGFLSDETYERDKNCITPYTFRVTNTVDYFALALISKIVTAVLAICLLYAVLGIWISGKKLALGSIALVLTISIISGVIFRKEIATMASIKEYAPGMYTCSIKNDYYLDEMLSTDFKDTDSLISYLSKKILGGMTLPIDAHRFGCSSFSCVTPEGTHLFGRNYDYMDTNGMVIYSNREGCYASIAVCDLQWARFAGVDSIAKPDSLLGRFILRGAAPIMCVDGFNDQGLGISILSLGYSENRPDTDKTDTIIILAIRGILDKCATVDEAVAFLSSYDVHSMFDKENHLFITDKSGKSVVAEWVNDELTVTEINYVTNYVIATHEYDDDRRFVVMKTKLDEVNGVLTLEEALDLLNAASQNSESSVQTEWSCVYDLDNFVLYIYNDNDRNTVYKITPETFK